jgi:ABC-type nitrate/sulfonate/bicarbonate transport system permease component
MTRTRILSVALSFALVVLAWWAASGTLFVAELVPTPLEVGRKLVGMVRTAELFAHLGASLRRILLGYTLGCALGLVVGVAMGAQRIFRDFVDPPLAFFRNIPPVALIPLVVSVFGIGEAGKYFIIAYAATIVMIFNAAAGVASTPAIRVRAALCLGARSRDIFLHVVIPSAWPYVLTGLRIALGFAFTAVVAAEMLAADRGIGFLIMQSTNILEARDMFIGFFLLGTLGLLTDQLFRAAIGRLARRYMLPLGRD